MGFIHRQLQHMIARPDRLATWGALLIILGIGLPLRLLDITVPFTEFHSWNEAHYTMIAHNFRLSGPFVQYDDLGLDYTTTPLVPWLIALSSMLFGWTEWAARLPIMLCGLASLWFLFVLGREFYGRVAAIIAVVIASTAPGIVYFSRNVQLDAPLVCCILAAGVALLAYRRQGRTYQYVLFVGLLCLAFLCKWTALLFWPFIAALWLWQPATGYLNRRLALHRVILAVVLPPLLPVSWNVWGYLQSPTYEGPLLMSYFNRTSEWSEGLFHDALRASVSWVGVYFPSFMLVLVVLAAPWLVVSWRRHLPALLLTLAIIPEYRYPVSFIYNIYYLYPTLYGLTLLCAAASDALMSAFAKIGRQHVIFIGLVGLIVVASTYGIDYYTGYMGKVAGGYLTGIAILRDVARAARPSDKILADSPQTMYYLGGDPHTVALLSTGCASGTALIGSHFYRDIVLLNQPDYGTTAALQESHYRLQQPYVWHLTDPTSKEHDTQPWLALPMSLAQPYCRSS